MFTNFFKQYILIFINDGVENYKQIKKENKMSNKAVLFKQVSNGFIIEDADGIVQVFPTIEKAQNALPNHFGENNENENAEVSKSEKPKSQTKKKEKVKEAKKSKDESIEEVNEDDLTLDHVREALRDFAKEHGKPAAKTIMEEVAGVKKMDDIPKEKFADVILTCEEAAQDELD